MDDEWQQKLKVSVWGAPKRDALVTQEDLLTEEKVGEKPIPKEKNFHLGKIQFLLLNKSTTYFEKP